MADSSTLEITLDDDRHTVRLDDLSAADAKAFRAAVGVPIAQVFNDPTGIDLDVIAGLIWLCKRRIQPTLSYDAVSRTLTYGSNFSIELGNGAAPKGDGGDPEA